MRVLVGCEFSGIVRDAFIARGHDAWSCDLLPTESSIAERHYQCDVRDVLRCGWDLGLFFPPCTYLTNSGVGWMIRGGQVIDNVRWLLMNEAADFFNELLNAPIPRIAVENPIMHRHARRLIDRTYNQIVQPWGFGHREIKATCLWLKNLPALLETNNVGPPPRDKIEKRKWARVHRASPSPERWKERSRFLSGYARAMAEQWESCS